MKKTILLIMAALSVSVAIGQRSLTLSVPKCTTFFKVGAAGLNMRKKPDAGSAKLMVWASDAGSSETVDRYYFSDENRGRYKANGYTGAFIETVHPGKGVLLPVTGESGDWVQVEWLADEVCIRAYVMKKFGTVTSVSDKGLETFCPSVPEYGLDGEELTPRNMATIHRTDGKYKDLCFSLTTDESYSVNDPFYATLRFPFLIDGKYLAVETANIQINPVQGLRAPVIYWEKEYGMDDEEYYTTNMKISTCAKNMQRQAVEDFLLNMPELQFERMLDSLLFNNDEHPLEIWICSGPSSYEVLDANMRYSSYPKCRQTFSFGANDSAVRKE